MPYNFVKHEFSKLFVITFWWNDLSLYIDHTHRIVVVVFLSLCFELDIFQYILHHENLVNGSTWESMWNTYALLRRCNECVLVLTIAATALKQKVREHTQPTTTTIYVQLLLQHGWNTPIPPSQLVHTCICQIKNIHLSFTVDLSPYIHGIYQKDPRILKLHVRGTPKIIIIVG